MQEIYDTHKMKNVAVKTSKRDNGDKIEMRWTLLLYCYSWSLEWFGQI